MSPDRRQENANASQTGGLWLAAETIPEFLGLRCCKRLCNRLAGSPSFAGSGGVLHVLPRLTWNAYKL